MMGFHDTLSAYFPNAREGAAFTLAVVNYLAGKGFTPENTLFGHSTCVDEVCRTVTKFAAHYGESFVLGGLAGIPFSGDAGFGAYAQHVPDRGNLLVLYGSHIAIGRDGEIGRIHRPGQESHSMACGAAYAALKWLESYDGPDGSPIPLGDIRTHQMNYIKTIFAANSQRILSADNRTVESINLLYEHIHALMTSIAGTYLASSQGERIALIGGVMVHGPDKGHFEPRDTIFLRKSGKPVTFLERILKEQ